MKRKRLSYKKSKRQFKERSVNVNKMNDKTIPRGGIRL